MSLESLERLRIGWCEALDRKAANAIADEIEREVAERFMELPVGKDGGQIHVGDTVFNEMWPRGERVHEIGFTDNDGTRIYNENGSWAHAGKCTHAEPDTWGRIIGDALDAGYRYGLASGRGEEPSDEVARAYAMGQYLERAAKLAEGGE